MNRIGELHGSVGMLSSPFTRDVEGRAIVAVAQAEDHGRRGAPRRAVAVFTQSPKILSGFAVRRLARPLSVTRQVAAGVADDDGDWPPAVGAVVDDIVSEAGPAEADIETIAASPR